MKHGEISRVVVPYFVHCPADEVIELTRIQLHAQQRGGVQRRLFVKGVATFPRWFLAAMACCRTSATAACTCLQSEWSAELSRWGGLHDTASIGSSSQQTLPLSSPFRLREGRAGSSVGRAALSSRPMQRGHLSTNCSSPETEAGGGTHSFSVGVTVAPALAKIRSTSLRKVCSLAASACPYECIGLLGRAKGANTLGGS